MATSTERDEVYKAMHDAISVPLDAVSAAVASNSDTPFIPQVQAREFSHLVSDSLAMDEIVPGVQRVVDARECVLELPGRGTFLGLRSAIDTTEDVRARSQFSAKQTAGHNAAVLPGFAHGEIMVKRADSQKALIERAPVVGLENERVIIDMSGTAVNLAQRYHGRHNYPVFGDVTVLPERSDGVTDLARESIVRDRAGMRNLERDVVREAQSDPAEGLRNVREHHVQPWQCDQPFVYPGAVKKAAHHSLGPDMLGHRPVREPVLDGATGRPTFGPSATTHGVQARVINYDRALRTTENRVGGQDRVFDYGRHEHTYAEEDIRKQTNKADRVIVDTPYDVGVAQMSLYNRAYTHIPHEGEKEHVDKRDLVAAFDLLAAHDSLSEELKSVRVSNPLHIEL